MLESLIYFSLFLAKMSYFVSPQKPIACSNSKKNITFICFMCLKTGIKTPERGQWMLFSNDDVVYIVTFEHVGYIMLGLLFRVNNKTNTEQI